MGLEWNSLGVLPPIWPGDPGNSMKRSPYFVDINQVISILGFSEPRQEILRGLLNYRKALYEAGITQGFQWIGGSFVEDIEGLENRNPIDVDVVTFFHLPDEMQQHKALEKYGSLFDFELTKKMYKVDAYAFQLGNPLSDYHVQAITYWDSMWSHRRNGIWKGFLQVNLSKDEDEWASKSLHLRGPIL